MLSKDEELYHAGKKGVRGSEELKRETGVQMLRRHQRFVSTSVSVVPESETSAMLAGARYPGMRCAS